METSLQLRLQTFKSRLQSNSEFADFYRQEVQAMELQLHQENSVFSQIRKNIIGRNEYKEMYTDDLQKYLDIVRTHEVIDMGTRWCWQWDNLGFAHYVKYK